MTVREFIRICKQAGCGEKFIVSAPSIEEDRLVGFSEPEYCPKHRAMHARSYSRIACHHFEIELTPEGEQLVRKIEHDKKRETSGSENLRGRVFDPWSMPGNGFGPGGLGRFQRPLRAFVEGSEFQPQQKKFQIAEKREEILAALEDHQVLVLVGTTGSGKSTYVPWLLLTGGEPGQLSKWARRGPICVTQPRIQATRQVPKFIANSLNGTTLGVGAQIGFTHSNAEEYDRRSRLVFMTDGKLINDIVSGRVGNYSIVMIDEAHERSVNIELILGLLRDQLYLYPHLRVIIASATIDFGAFLTYYYPHLKVEAESFAAINLKDDYGYFKWDRRVPFVYSEGRRYPIAEHFWGAPELEPTRDGPRELMPGWWKKINHGQLPARDQLPDAIAELVRLLCKTLDDLPPAIKAKEDGHILVFLPGSREIDKTVSLIKALNLPEVAVLPLYAQRPLDEQDAALDPKPDKHPQVFGKRRVVVSTNVAETSLTVEGVKHVIDSGYIKISFWNPHLKIAELQTIPHSQAGCRQRWGRAGRIEAGHAYMLYTRKQFDDNFPSHSTPEIARASLEDVILTAKAAGVRSLRQGGTWCLAFEWMPLASSQDQERFRVELDRAHQSLVTQKAIDKEDGDLTAFGLELRGMPAEMDVARIFTEGEKHALGIEVATLLPFLNLDHGIQSLLKWKPEWDSYEKLSIRNRQLDFFYGCRDDLELYLKLWTLWDYLTDKQRHDWEDVSGVDYKTFHDKIELERRKLLEMAIDWRKAENRPVAISKIDALRALIVYCLQDEIYQPLEAAIAADRDQAAFDRLQAPIVLSWESGWDQGDSYEEYDDDFSVDPSYAVQSGVRSGLFRRFYRQPADTEESSVIEIAPTSVCFGRDDIELLVACRRRANYIRPARTKILGMNMIRLKQEWLSALQGSLVHRSHFYAALSHRQSLDTHRRSELRLFLPWLLPRGSRISGRVRTWDPEQGGLVEFRMSLSKARGDWQRAVLGKVSPGKVVASGQPAAIEQQDNPDSDTDDAVGNAGGEAQDREPVVHVDRGTAVINGWLLVGEIEEGRRGSIQAGDEILAEVRGYSVASDGNPLLVLGTSNPHKEAFTRFNRRYRNKLDTPISVQMVAVIEDPLGRNPMFLVRELVTGLEIPMADSDFCGHTHPQPYFGRRFDPGGEPFDVYIDKIDAASSKVSLSRGRQLFREYSQLSSIRDFTILDDPPIVKVDHLGAYFAISGTGGGSAYIGFARRSLWPAGFNLKPGDRVKARFRRRDKHINIARMQERLDTGLPLPDELDLGIDLDLTTPPAYERFCEHHRPGDLISATVEKILDSGGLLTSVDFGLKAMIYESELGLDENGFLKKGRDYRPGMVIDVRVTKLEKDTATIRCSIARVPPVPELERGKVVPGVIISIREDSRQTDKVWLVCSFNRRYPVKVTALLQPGEPPFVVGEEVDVTIKYLDRRENSVEGVITNRHQKEQPE